MWTIVEGGILAAALVVPALTALPAFLFGRLVPRGMAGAGAVAAGFSFLAAVAMAIGSARGQTATWSPHGADFAVDRLAAVLLLLVFGVSLVVQSFAVRYLAGDRRASWFTGGAGLLTSASAGLITANTLVSLAGCWTLAGVALCLLLGTYWELPAARDGVRRTVVAFLIGDAALWAAVAIATANRGGIELTAPAGGSPPSVPALPVVGLLVVLAALSRSAQIPFHRWLPATLAAPTPVSALLHAGVVNAGGILLIRLAPLATGDLARALTVVAGAATMAYGAAVMLVKPDVKGALAHSTAAQMGFMIMTCGLGLWAAAVIHLVAHGFYKATLFLSSGSAVAARRRHQALPQPGPVTAGQRLVMVAAAAALPAAALAIALAVVPLAPAKQAADQALLIFAWATGAAVAWGWLQRRRGPAGVSLAGGFLAAAAIGYLAVLDAVGGFLAPALPTSVLPVTAVWAVTSAAALGLVALALVRRIPGAQRLRNILYTRALTAGHIPAWRTSPVLPTGARP